MFSTAELFPTWRKMEISQSINIKAKPKTIELRSDISTSNNHKYSRLWTPTKY